MKKFVNFLLYPITLFLKPFFIAPIVIAAGIVAGATVATNVFNYFTNKKTNKENLANQAAVNEANLKFATEQLNEQKYLNRNQYQLQASDMQKAGLNPAMASAGSTLQAGSYQSNQQSIPLNPYNIDSSAINTIADLYMQSESLKAQEKMSSESNATQLEIAQINANASRYSADSMSASSKYSSDRSYDASKYATDEQVKEIKRHNEQTEKATRSQIQQRQMEIWDNYNLAEKQVEQAWEQLRLAKTKQDREHYLNVYNSAIKTLQTISSEAREWYDSATFQHMFNKNQYHVITAEDLPF